MIQTKDKESTKQFSTGGWGAHYVLITCTLLYVINYADRQVFSVVLQPMKVELGLTDAQLGLAQTLFLLGMALFSFPIAYLVDRWSRKKTIAVMAVLWSATTFLTGLGKNLIGIIIPRSLVGVGEAGFTAGGTAIISAVYPKEFRSRALGIFSAAAPIGIALGLMVGGWISTTYGWRSGFFIFAVPGVLLGILALFMKDYKSVVRVASGAVKEGLWHDIVNLLKIPTLRWFYLGFGILSFMTSTFLTWVPTLAVRTANMSVAAAGMVVGYMALVAIIGSPLGGFLADYWQKKDRRGRIYLATLTSFLSALCVIGLVIAGFGPLGIVIGMLYGTINIMVNPSLGAVSQDVAPAAHKGLSYGLAIFCTYALGGAWGPVAVGAISDAFGGGGGGLSIALIISAGFGIIGALFLLLAARHYGPDMEKVQAEALLA